MLVFRPKKVIGTYRGFDVILASKVATENARKFDAACASFEDRLQFIHDSEKDK